MLSQKTHRIIYLFGLCSLAFGMMVGTVPTSVPQLILLGNWLVEADFKRKWLQLKSNRIFWVMTAVFFIHALGIVYSGNVGAGIKDVKTKLPLLFLPVLLFTNERLSLKEFYLLLYCFLAGCLVNTTWCFIYNFVLHKNEIGRQASRFMSHIRLGLYLNMAVATCVYFAAQATTALKRFVWIAAGLYFLFSMYVLGLITGLANFMILCFLTVCVVVYLQKPLVKLVSTLLLVCIGFFVINYVRDIKHAQLKVNDVAANVQQLQSPSGRYYAHFDTAGQRENGNYVQINIQTEELKKQWNLRVPEDTFSYPPNAHNLNRYEVLIRYLSSKGLNKDSAGIAALDAEDEKNIRKNMTNYSYASWSFLHKRTYELVCEYDDFLNNRGVNGQSLTMRLYFWKAAAHLIVQNPLAGVGTGDVQQELNKTYIQTRTPLKEEWYKRPHNQFLTVTVALGIPGLLFLLISVFYPALVLRQSLHLLYWPFFILAIISFIMEDTLETQAGLSFYAVFNSLFICQAVRNKANEVSGGG